MAAPLTLRTAYQDTADGAGTIDLTLSSDEPLPDGWRLALTSIVPLAPPDDVATVVRRVGTYHELAPGVGEGACPQWTVGAIVAGHRARHANDGPVVAFVILADGTTRPVDVAPMARAGDVHRRTAATSSPVAVPAVAHTPPLVPMPRHVRSTAGTRVHRRLQLDDRPDAAAHAWHAVASLAARLGLEPALLDSGSLPITARLDATLDPEAYRIHVERDRGVVVASGSDGFRQAFVTLAQWAVAGVPGDVVVEDAPRWRWRGLHVDLARRWYEPAVVERILDLAAWRKLDRVHLHLTDDEAWRVPVPRWPQLASIGGTRGHGLALPPMLGSGPQPYGRAYTEAEIGRWVDRAGELGVVLVPEIDVPAHCHAALEASPDLRDPADRSGAASIQHYVDNVLVPGAPATAAFLADAFGALARLFPTSPWLHIGGDEVPHGAWRGSPVVAAHRAARRLDTTRDVEAAFHRDLVHLVATTTGRAVGAWQEAAQSGGVRPGDGYVVGWTSPDAARELSAAGHDVVVSPGQAYYLDMAPDGDWETPGMSWAGTVTFDDTCAFEPDAGWSADERARLLGVQACLWSEHVADVATFDRLVFPRLDAVAERGWTGRIDGGPAALLARAARLPRLGSTA